MVSIIFLAAEDAKGEADSKGNGSVAGFGSFLHSGVSWGFWGPHVRHRSLLFVPVLDPSCYLGWLVWVLLHQVGRRGCGSDAGMRMLLLVWYLPCQVLILLGLIATGITAIITLA